MSFVETPGRAASRRAAVRRWVLGRDVGLAYAAIVVLVGFVLAVVPQGVADRFVGDSSTNLVNLRQHPPYVLVASAFVVPSVWQLWVLVPLVWSTVPRSGGWDAAAWWSSRSSVISARRC